MLVFFILMICRDGMEVSCVDRILMLLVFFFVCREFVQKNYKELKTMNPKLPILIRECSGTEPQLWARYGIETWEF